MLTVSEALVLSPLTPLFWGLSYISNYYQSNTLLFKNHPHMRVNFLSAPVSNPECDQLHFLSCTLSCLGLSALEEILSEKEARLI
jgi:hypothetical protein